MVAISSQKLTIKNVRNHEVQKDARNVPDPYIQKFWRSTTSVKEGLTKVFYEMKKNYE